jgi:hypothetical protein
VRGDMRISLGVMPPAAAGSGPRAPSLPTAVAMGDTMSAPTGLD